MTADRTTLAGLIADAIEEVEDEWRANKGQPYFEDRLHEIADSAVPIYNGDLLEAAESDYDLVLTEPELGPAFDGTPTPINIIAANIYEAIYHAISKRYNELEAENDND